jgi:hypothetical protein
MEGGMEGEGRLAPWSKHTVANVTKVSSISFDRQLAAVYFLF